MTPLGLYEPGSSLVHRAAAGGKLAAVLALTTGTLVLDPLPYLGAVCLLVAAGYAVARIPARRLLPLLRGQLVLVAMIFLLQSWLLGPAAAAATALRISAVLGAATLLTLTTRITDLVATVERALRPLGRMGVPVDRIGLLVGLTLHAVNTLSEIAASVREAALARGAERSVVAFAVPFLVRTLRHAEELGEALAARGIGED